MEQKEDKIKKLTGSVTRLEEKKNRIYFYLPSVPQASGGIGVVYEHAKTLSDLGYPVHIIYEAVYEKNTKGQDVEVPFHKAEWLGTEYSTLSHLEINKVGDVGPDDLFVIPEGTTPFMEKIKQIPSMKVVLCQSYLYVLGALMPGMTWSEFGIKDVIVVTSTLEQYVENIFGKGRFEIKTIRPSINESIFKKGNKPKKPIIAISSRDRMMTTNIIKHFYAVYPQYRWVTFKEMTNLSREEFAETLQDSCLAVWLDRVAGFGTFPIECAKTNTPFIALIPDIIPEYAKDNAGVWTNNVLSIPQLIAEYFKVWMEDKEPQEVLDGIAELATTYTKVDEEKNIELVYGEYFDKRKNEILAVIEKIKEEE